MPSSDTKKKREFTPFLLALALLFMVAIVYLAEWDAYGEEARSMSDIVMTNDEYIAMLRQLRTDPEYGAKMMEEIDRRLDELEDKVPLSPDLEGFLNGLKTAADESGVELGEIELVEANEYNYRKLHVIVETERPVPPHSPFWTRAAAIGRGSKLLTEPGGGAARLEFALFSAMPKTHETMLLENGWYRCDLAGQSDLLWPFSKMIGDMHQKQRDQCGEIFSDRASNERLVMILFKKGRISEIEWIVKEIEGDGFDSAYESVGDAANPYIDSGP